MSVSSSLRTRSPTERAQGKVDQDIRFHAHAVIKIRAKRADHKKMNQKREKETIHFLL